MLKEAWNLHQAQTECTGIPEKICLNGMIGIFAKPVPGFDDLNLYEFHPQAPHTHDDELTTVAVDDIDTEIPEDVHRQLSCYINPLQESTISFGLHSLHRSIFKIWISILTS